MYKIVFIFLTLISCTKKEYIATPIQNTKSITAEVQEVYNCDIKFESGFSVENSKIKGGFMSDDNIIKLKECICKLGIENYFLRKELMNK